MKKPFLMLVAVACVAVSTVFATAKPTTSVLLGSPYNDQGECTTPGNVIGTCDVNYTGNACQLLAGGDAYLQDTETGLCTIPLYRQN
ncbi:MULTISPECIES: hypothetical protein [Pedobacter]|uniref:Uncharacterized protein n=1 Tax=Pedobacter heparinus (strain ATCC 13125 / DSM 2366 / CIP 104194 / JCM 7457 / NBRC 12017 / NCIMB 9290 / NRRL B-14731 / HIM 762-3) TaxID=485917 RepID=C6XVG9_PEDHD|nr:MULTISPECIES: hypothetical protein [Pedobacter]ACU04035.1 hypothetical protein Phep_1827 [Pedobacter heparinus DSM 2366]MBB5436942.1 hypothetical protein [Pedobacter sp. AK017]MBB5437350.1 hypothetical protein [Pedobacter sp. AK017]MBB5438016.1 hypothetical protein [Pedobacter sp. AK017]